MVSNKKELPITLKVYDFTQCLGRGPALPLKPLALFAMAPDYQVSYLKETCSPLKPLALCTLELLPYQSK
jgi:hypothetical protein